MFFSRRQRALSPVGTTLLPIARFLYFLAFSIVIPLPRLLFFFFNDTAPTEIYPLSLHAALPISLPKGMTQKLGLAAALSLERGLYVLDEPMSGLDPAARVAVKSVLGRLSREGRTLFFTSHVLADVEELCSSIAVLERSRLRFRGSPRTLCERYGESTLERAFMRCIRDDERALRG